MNEIDKLRQELADDPSNRDNRYRLASLLCGHQLSYPPDSETMMQRWLALFHRYPLLLPQKTFAWGVEGSSSNYHHTLPKRLWKNLEGKREGNYIVVSGADINLDLWLWKAWRKATTRWFFSFFPKEYCPQFSDANPEETLAFAVQIPGTIQVLSNIWIRDWQNILTLQAGYIDLSVRIVCQIGGWQFPVLHVDNDNYLGNIKFYLDKNQLSYLLMEYAPQQYWFIIDLGGWKQVSAAVSPLQNLFGHNLAEWHRSLANEVFTLPAQRYFRNYPKPGQFYHNVSASFPFTVFADRFCSYWSGQQPAAIQMRHLVDID